MVDRHRHSVSQIEEARHRPRWGSLANERSLLDLLDGDQNRLQPTSFTLGPINSNLYARRHSSHICPLTGEHAQAPAPIPPPPPVPQRPPAVPKRNVIPPPITTNANQIKTNMRAQSQPPPIPPIPKSRVLPPIPSTNSIPKPVRTHASTDATNVCNLKKYDLNRNPTPKQNNKATVAFSFDNNSLSQVYSKIPPPPTGAPPPAPKIHKPNVTPVSKVPVTQQTPITRVSVRQDSSVSSDSFSQTSSPSYTTKTMETPLLPPRTPVRQQNGILSKIKDAEDDSNGNQTITKSVSTPASLQTIVRFHNGSNMSLHHRIIRDMRRPSSIYRQRWGFRVAQIILNAIALLAIGAGMAAYFKAVIVVNDNTTTVGVTKSPVIERKGLNPYPGICLPVIVSFCQQHKVPYNYTVYPNYMGHFGQRHAQQELEVYDVVVDVRCYELAALFLCSLFVPKCGPGGDVVRPCRSLCFETKRRCGFFLDVFGLELPDYLECDMFPESPEPSKCIGSHEVKEAKKRESRPQCPSGFQCDAKRCIPRDWKCDGHVDCKDQSDELNCKKCGPGMIHCGEDKCITQEHMCDGFVDCPWGQDERNCLRLSEKNGDEGRGQLEVYRPDHERWVPACVDYWDERNSAKKICSLLGYSTVNNSTLLKGTHVQSSPVETTSIWRMNQNAKPENLLKDFGSCNGTDYTTVSLSCVNYMCGKARKSYAERRVRIVGGTRSKPGDWPFLAALLGGPEEIFYCAGVLIADQWVLTASHCVGNHSNVTGWTIQLGITRRHAHSFYGQKMKVKRVVPHPMYNLEVAHDNDVALFQLSSRVTFHEHLLPVCLPPANKELHPGTVCTVIGWGKKEDTGKSDYEPEVNEVEVPVLNRDLCNTWLENRELNVTDGMICAGYKEGGKDACQGDSGGPLLCRDERDPDQWFVGGIVSWGIKCAHPHLPGVYAYVPKYIPWIQEQIRHYSD